MDEMMDDSEIAAWREFLKLAVPPRIRKSRSDLPRIPMHLRCEGEPSGASARRTNILFECEAGTRRLTYKYY